MRIKDIKHPLIRRVLGAILVIIMFIFWLFFPIIEAIHTKSKPIFRQNYSEGWVDLCEAAKEIWSGPEKNS